jgi:hypothetical protein
MRRTKDTIFVVDEDAPLTEAELNFARFLKGKPTQFQARTPYSAVSAIFEALIEYGWIESPVHLKAGPSRTLIEYTLRDGWRVYVDAPCEFNGDRDRKLTMLGFLGPGDPSPPRALAVKGFSQSPAFPSRWVYGQPKRQLDGP